MKNDNAYEPLGDTMTHVIIKETYFKLKQLVIDLETRYPIVKNKEFEDVKEAVNNAYKIAETIVKNRDALYI